MRGIEKDTDDSLHVTCLIEQAKKSHFGLSWILLVWA